MFANRDNPKKLIGELNQVLVPDLIGELPPVDENDPVYKLLDREYKQWDGAKPIEFTADQLIRISLSKRSYFLCNIAPHTSLAVADMHHFVQGSHTGAIHGAIVENTNWGGLYSLRVETSQGIEFYDPGLMPVEIGHIDFDS